MSAFLAATCWPGLWPGPSPSRPSPGPDGAHGVPDRGEVAGVAIFTAAGIYQLTPWKDWCLRRCRSPIGALLYYLGFKGRSRDVRVGLHHGATCAGAAGA